MDIRFFMRQDIFPQENYKIIKYMFQIKNILGVLLSTSKVLSWKSLEFSEKSVENLPTSGSNFAPTLISCYPLPDIKFNGQFLIDNNNQPSLGAVNLIFVTY